MSIVSNNIKYLRRLNGLTQEQFARKIGIKRSLLGAYEEARANPNLTNLKNMAHAFGVSVDNLLKNDLRKLRETPDLGLPFNPASLSPVSPLMRESSSMIPQPLSAVIARFQPLKPELRLVARPITLKPIHQEKFKEAISNPVSSQIETLRFNNHYEEIRTVKATSHSEPASQQQVIQLIRKNQIEEYASNFQNSTFLHHLPIFSLPNLPPGHYRAFESGDDFLFPGSLLIGTFIRNWYEIKDSVRYIFVTKRHGIITRISFNQVKTKGVLLLKADNENVPDIEISIKEVIEVWEIKAFISSQLPPLKPAYSKLRDILTDLRDELNRAEISANFLT